MTRHLSPNNKTSVPVLDPDGKPVSPTRPSRARRWLESGKAVREWKHGHFAVRLLNPVPAHPRFGGVLWAAVLALPGPEQQDAQNITLNLDPGKKTTGVTVVLNRPDGAAQVIAAFELHHRGQAISIKMKSRRDSRKSRRSRKRHRPARFNNRARKPGYMPPSLESIRANILTNVRHLTELFPVTGIRIETSRFDPRLMQDPDIFGAEYQTSERGRMQTREYVLQRDQRTCQYRKHCPKGKPRLEVDHIVPRSRNGPDRVSNLITACHECNDRKSNQSLEDFMTEDPAGLARIKAQTRKSLADATQMNRLMPVLLEGLEQTGLTVSRHDAITTAHTRKRLGIAKTHANDAAALGEPAGIANIPKRVTTISSVGHGSRQMLTSRSKYGTPRYQEGAKGKHGLYRAWCRLSRDQQGYTTMPGHKLRQSRACGISSGDLIRYRHKDDGDLIGYAALSQRNAHVGTKGKKSVKVQSATMLARNNGYRHGRAPNETRKPN